jgi:TolB-like protein/Tfp pilus assembly protein PilF
VDQDVWRRVEDLFHESLACPPESRAEFLDGACNGDSELRREVERLLAKEARAGRFLETPAVPGDPSASLLGLQIGAYRILSPLGAGGMGEVYRANDGKLGRDVAIKTLPPEFARDPGRMARFRREARTLAALNHPNIGAIYGLEESREADYLILELVEGDTLAGPLPLNAALDCARQLAEALEAAHAQGIIHRDLKPANVKVTKGASGFPGRVKVLDFGLAKAVWGAESEQDLTGLAKGAAAESLTGSIAGTPGYMSPEQARGRPVDQRADIWAFGCLLYELLAGKRAFAGESPAGTLAAVLEHEPDWQALPAKTPPAVRDLLRQCLQKDPGGRPSTIADARKIIEAAQRGRSRRGTVAIAAAGLALLFALCAVGFFLLAPRPGSADSLAVLPFASAGGVENAEYLGEGIAEYLTNRLAQLPKLRVAARTLAFRFKGSQADPQRAGRDLHVGTVLTGRVVERGGALNIEAELIRVEDGSRIWGARYDRGVADLVAVQEEIAGEVSGKLRQTVAAKHFTPNAEAYELYLKGRYYWNRRTEQTLRRAAEYFQKAIEKDPGYAMAYAGLADCYALYTTYSIESAREAAPKAKAAATRALEIDDSLASAHASLGRVKMQYDWDWDGSEREMRRAIELDPNYATAHQWYANLLAITGRNAQGIASLRRAQQLDPLSMVVNGDLGWLLFLARRYDESIEVLRTALEMDPAFAPGHWGLGLPYEQKSMYREAAAEFQKVLEDSRQDARALGDLGHVYAVSGQRPKALSVLNELRAISRTHYVAPMYFALIYSGLGDREHTFEHLEKGFADRSWGMVFLKSDPRFDALRTDPRFANLIARMGL